MSDQQLIINILHALINEVMLPGHLSWSDWFLLTLFSDKKEKVL